VDSKVYERLVQANSRQGGLEDVPPRILFLKLGWGGAKGARGEARLSRRLGVAGKVAKQGPREGTVEMAAPD